MNCLLFQFVISQGCYCVVRDSKIAVMYHNKSRKESIILAEQYANHHNQRLIIDEYDPEFESLR